MQEVEQLFTALPPKFVLDHYFEILSLIGWRAPLEFADEKRMSLSDIRNSILRNANEFKTENPHYSRVWLRSLDVAEEVIDILLKAGLLVKEGETFQRAEGFSRASYSLKKMKSNAKRQIAWAIWYFHRKGVASFDASKLLATFSYKDEHYLGELSDLSLWKTGSKHVKILSKSGNKWQIVEKPPLPSKTFLSLNLTSRLFAAVSRIADSENVFSDQNIIKKIRELEIKSMEKILIRWELEQGKAGEWFINERTLESVKEVLLESLETCWPSFGDTVFKNPYFKLGSRTAYVDVPNEFTTLFLNGLEFLGEKYSNDLEELHQKALELKDAYNKNFEENVGKSLKFVIRKETFGEKRLGIQVRIDWSNLCKFLDDLAKSDVPLEDKYEYLFLCRSSLAWMKSTPRENQMKDSVKMFAMPEIREINRMIERFIDSLNTLKDKMRQKFIVRKHLFPLTLAYLSEMVSTLEVIKNCVNEGTVSTCYREMRKILENLSWAMFDDLLLFKRTDKYLLKFIPSFRMLSKKWYDWAQNENAMLKNMDELSKRLEKIIEATCLLRRIGEHDWTKKRIEDALIDNLTYPLFILFTGVNKQLPRKLEGLVPQYDVKELKPLVREHLENAFVALKTRPLSKFDKKIVREFVQSSMDKMPDKIIVPYPSNGFVLSIISKMLGLNLNGFYGRYSYFVHSYDKAWQLSPFSSVVEFKILREELASFLNSILQTMHSYLKEIPR